VSLQNTDGAGETLNYYHKEKLIYI